VKDLSGLRDACLLLVYAQLHLLCPVQDAAYCMKMTVCSQRYQKQLGYQTYEQDNNASRTDPKRNHQHTEYRIIS
jgi:hypothetical protein